MKKLFVSSTFKDMQLERDSLKKHIIPNLNLKLREYGTKISQTDLRWGISTSELSSEESEQKILNVCLEEINKSRPYMIVMIGERYGWIPSPAIIEMNARGRDIHLETNDISVTQLEIEYIAFMEKWDESRIFFYFRDLDTSRMDDEAREIYGSESAIAKEKLTKLKKRIEAKFPNQIRHYTLDYKDGELHGIESFEKLVSDDLYSLFCRDLKDDQGIDVNERVRDKLHGEAMESFPIFVPAYDIPYPLSTTDVSPSERNHYYISGLPRSGKTLSVIARYVAFYSYQHQNNTCWDMAKYLFAKPNFPHFGGGRFNSWLDSVDVANTYPLYIQIGNNRDIIDNVDFLRTFLYFLNKHLGIDGVRATSREEYIKELCNSLRVLMESKKCFYLFVDDLSGEALNDLFEIENHFTEDEVSVLIKHLYYFIALNNEFPTAPVYLPFYKHSRMESLGTELGFADDFLLAYAKKLGKELSVGVEKYLHLYYGYTEERPEDYDLTKITRSHASLMANYAMNFTSEDYQLIKANGNDMSAIESRQLQLLRALKGNFHEDMSGDTLKKVALLNVEKFSKNHSESTLKSLGIIYILSGITFTMEEAEYLATDMGFEWSDLEYISYFDDFREFFLYDADEDSYRTLTTFQTILREHFVQEYLGSDEKIQWAVDKLISALKGAPFYESKRTELISSILLVPNSSFVKKALDSISLDGEDSYCFAKRIGESAEAFVNSFSIDYIRKMGMAIAPILASEKDLDFICGFFDGLGHAYKNHKLEKKIMVLADELSRVENEYGATPSYRTRVALLKAYCYLGYKNNVAIDFLYQAEPYIATSDKYTRVKILSILVSLLPCFKPKSPYFNRIINTVKENIGKAMPLSENDERALTYRGDLFTLAYYTRLFYIKSDFYDAEELLAPLLSRECFAKIGFYNIETAIKSQDARKIGMDELILRTRTFMQSLASSRSAHKPCIHRLICKCLFSRFLNATRVSDGENVNTELEKYFYPYKKAMVSAHGTAYGYIDYASFLHNSIYFHNKTGITHQYDELMWETNKMSNWEMALNDIEDDCLELIIEVCWCYVTFLQMPDMNDMITGSFMSSYSRFAEEGSESPSVRALLYRLTQQLKAVLKNPTSRIMKPKLKRLFRDICEHYGDYIDSLSNNHLDVVREYIEGL